MRLATCKRCGLQNLQWIQVNNKWVLAVQGEDWMHTCEKSGPAFTKCKHCGNDDLHWVEEIQPDGKKKYVITESYGLPHFCKEGEEAGARLRKEKQDKYAAEKARLALIPDGAKCECADAFFTIRLCPSCLGYRYFSRSAKRAILSNMRTTLWPHLKDPSLW